MAYCCSNPWTTFFIWGNGDVTHCCYSSFGVLGNIHQQGLEDIWRGPRWDGLRTLMARGDFPRAGCEPWCRVVRWDRFYGRLACPPPIPDGLGRLENGTQPAMPTHPAILGLATPWICDLKCTHCLSERKGSGLSSAAIDRIWPQITQAEVLRLMDGEFTINRESLALLRCIAELPRPPRVFMNTHAQTLLERWWPSVDSLPSFHLKCSLEGTGENYERIRRGGTWQRFSEHVAELGKRFRAKREAGLDWQLFLNGCVMAGNLDTLPELVNYAVSTGLPLVLNVIHGMRHVDENFGAYAHLRWDRAQVQALQDRIDAELEGRHYPYESDLRQHLDYVFRVLEDPRKVQLPLLWRRWLTSRPIGMGADRLLGLWLRWRWDRRGATLSLVRKVRKRLMRGMA